MKFDSELEREVTQRYADAGYSVSRPSGPGETFQISSGHFVPDFIAKKGDEIVIIELASRRMPKPSLGELASAVKERGWRFDLIAGPLQGQTQSPQPLDVLEIQRRIQVCENLAMAGDNALSVLIGWTTLEALLNFHKAQLGLHVVAKGPSQIIKEAVSLGILEESEVLPLTEIGGIRNLIVHGFHADSVHSSDCEYILMIIRGLLADILESTASEDY